MTRDLTPIADDRLCDRIVFCLFWLNLTVLCFKWLCVHICDLVYSIIFDMFGLFGVLCVFRRRNCVLERLSARCLPTERGYFIGGLLIFASRFYSELFPHGIWCSRLVVCSYSTKHWKSIKENLMFLEEEFCSITSIVHQIKLLRKEVGETFPDLHPAVDSVFTVGTHIDAVWKYS